MKSQAAIEPPRPAPPPLRSERPDGIGPSNSSARVHCTPPGGQLLWPDERLRRAASPVCLPPKPPPKWGTITRTRSGGTPTASATCWRTLKGLLVPVQTVTRSFCHWATAERGHGGVLHVGDLIGRLQPEVRRRQALLTEPSRDWSRGAASVLEQVVAGWLLDGLPLGRGRDGLQCLANGEEVGATHPTKPPSRAAITPGISARRQVHAHQRCP